MDSPYSLHIHRPSLALVSEDLGETWSKEYAVAISPDDDCGYPASVELPDGSIATVYYQHYVDPVTGEPDRKVSAFCTKWSL